MGLRSNLLTATQGEAVVAHRLKGYEPYKGEIVRRYTGSLIASETGEATSYGLYNSQERGDMFIPVQTPVYEGMIVGQSPKLGDIAVNVCKKKHLTAVRSTGADEALKLVTPIIFSLEEAIEFIADDELIEITPKSIRLRKKILDNSLRLKAQSKKNQ
jgi:GTP-binding protein